MSGQFGSYSVVSGSGGGGGGGVSNINGQTGPGISIAAGSGISVASGSNVITVTATGSVGTVPQVEYRSLTSGEVTAKALTLAHVPADATKVIVDIIKGCSQQYLVDYTVAADIVSWNSLGLDGLVSAGDVLRFIYFT